MRNLQGDFTPLHEAAVEFQQMTLPNGQAHPFCDRFHNTRSCDAAHSECLFSGTSPVIVEAAVE